MSLRMNVYSYIELLRTRCYLAGAQPLLSRGHTRCCCCCLGGTTVVIWGAQPVLPRRQNLCCLGTQTLLSGDTNFVVWGAQPLLSGGAQSDHLGEYTRQCILYGGDRHMQLCELRRGLFTIRHRYGARCIHLFCGEVCMFAVVGS